MVGREFLSKKSLSKTENDAAQTNFQRKKIASSFSLIASLNYPPKYNYKGTLNESESSMKTLEARGIHW